MSVLVRWKLRHVCRELEGEGLSWRVEVRPQPRPRSALPTSSVGGHCAVRFLPKGGHVFSLWARIAFGIQSKVTQRHQGPGGGFAFPKMK